MASAKVWEPKLSLSDLYIFTPRDFDFLNGRRDLRNGERGIATNTPNVAERRRICAVLGSSAMEGGVNQRLTTQVNNGALGLAVEGGGMRSVEVHLMSAGGGEGPRPPQAIHNAGVKTGQQDARMASAASAFALSFPLLADLSSLFVHPVIYRLFYSTSLFKYPRGVCISTNSLNNCSTFTPLPTDSLTLTHPQPPSTPYPL